TSSTSLYPATKGGSPTHWNMHTTIGRYRKWRKHWVNGKRKSYLQNAETIGAMQLIPLRAMQGYESLTAAGWKILILLNQAPTNIMWKETPGNSHTSCHRTCLRWRVK